MLKSELIRQISLKNKNLAIKDVESAVKIILQEMTDCLQNNNNIEIRGFGTFSTKYQKPRRAINPKSQEFLDLPARYLAHFRVGKTLHNAINKIESE